MTQYAQALLKFSIGITEVEALSERTKKMSSMVSHSNTSGTLGKTRRYFAMPMVLILTTAGCTGSTEKQATSVLAPTSKSFGLSDQSLAAVVERVRSGSTASQPDGLRSLCSLGSNTSPIVGPVNAASGAAAMDLGIFGMAFNSCGVPAGTVGPFFSAGKTTFIAQNLPLIFEAIQIPGESAMAPAIDVPVAKLYAFNKNGVWPDTFLKTQSITRPAEIPEGFEIYLRLPSDGTLLAVTPAEAGKKRNVIVNLPGGLTKVFYDEFSEGSGVFYVSAVATRSASDLAGEFSSVVTYSRDSNGRIAGTISGIVYRKTMPAPIQVTGRNQWQYDQQNSRLSKVIDEKSGKSYTFSYGPDGSLSHVDYGPEASSDDGDRSEVVKIEFNGQKISYLSTDRNSRYSYDLMGRLSTITQDTVSGPRIKNQFCYKNDPVGKKYSTRRSNGYSSYENTLATYNALSHDDTVVIEGNVGGNVGGNTNGNGAANGNVLITSSQRPSSQSSQITVDRIGRILQAATSSKGDWTKPESVARFIYSAGLMALPTEVQIFQGEASPVSTVFEYHVFGQPRKATVGGRTMFEVSAWFDDLIPKVYNQGGQKIELSASADALSSSYRRKINGVVDAEAEVQYAIVGDNEGVRIVKNTTKNLRSGESVEESASTEGTSSLLRSTFDRVVSLIVSVVTPQGESSAQSTTGKSTTNFIGPQHNSEAPQFVAGSEIREDLTTNSKYLMNGVNRFSDTAGSTLNRIDQTSYAYGLAALGLSADGNLESINGTAIPKSADGDSSQVVPNAPTRKWNNPADCSVGSDAGRVEGFKKVADDFY